MNAARVLRARWLSLVLLALVAGWLAPRAHAEDLRESTSLKFVPEKVAFYSMSLRLREQYEAFVQSKAFKTLSEVPSVNMGRLLLSNWLEANENAAAVRSALDQEENKQAVAALLDAISHEVFVYGGEGYGDLIRLANDLNRAQREAQIQAATQGGRSEELLAEKVLEKLSEALDGAELPTTVAGFRVSDRDRVKTQLGRLEKLLKDVFAQQPELAKRLTREKLGEAEYLTLKLDGSLIPWEQVYESAGDKRAEMEKLAAKVKPMTLTVAIGLWNDYLIVSTAKDGSHLSKLGQGPRLADRKEFKQIDKHLDQRIVNIGYASESFVRKANSLQQQTQEMVDVAQQLLPASGLEEDVQKELLDDVRKLAKAAEAHLPEPGAAVGVSFMTDRGYEGYTYSWAKNDTVDASQPLTILQHLGGSPILLAAIRGKYDPRCFDAMATIASRVRYYAEKIALKEADEEERQLYEKARDELLPLIRKMGDVTRDQLAPAMKDGQMALAVDAKAKSQKWHQAMPEAQQELPMLETAIVFGVNDSAAVQSAAEQYFSLVQEMLRKLHEIRDDIPEIELPPPDTADSEAGKVYFYPLPMGVGLDKEIAPSMGLSKDALVFSLFPKQSQRAIESKPLKLEGPLGALDRPMASFVHLDVAALVDAISPWVDYGFAVASEDQPNMILDTIKPQVQSVLSVLKCFRGITSATYQEDGVWVTHAEVELKDLE